MPEHTLQPINDPNSPARWRCATCKKTWRSRPQTACPGKICYSLQNRPDHLLTENELERSGLKPPSKTQCVAFLDFTPSSPLYDKTTCQPLWQENERHVIQRGNHLIEFTEKGERCVRCERHYSAHAWGACAGVRQFSWSNWPTGFFTERQLRARHLLPGPVRGAIWYEKSKDHWLHLYREDEALQPSTRTRAQLKATQKMLAAAQLRRTCRYCNRKADYPEKGGGLCRHCSVAEWATTIIQANPVFLDTETTGLDHDAEVLEIAVIDLTGRILINTYIRPQHPILEIMDTSPEDSDYGEYGSNRLTAFEVNGITNEMVANAPAFPDVWQQLQPVLNDRLILAYNASFDRQMLLQNATRYHLPHIRWCDWDCIMTAFAEWCGEWSYRHRSWKYHSLEEAAYTFKAQTHPTHSALTDCQTQLEVLKHLTIFPAKLETN